MRPARAPGIAVTTSTGTNTLDHVIVISKGDTAGVGFLGGGTSNVTALGVLMQATTANAHGVVDLGAVVNLDGALVRLPPGSQASGIAAGGLTTTLTLDSSIVEGGAKGVYAAQASAGTVTVTVRRSTIDAATPGVDDAGTTGYSGYAETQGSASAVATLNIVESLLVDRAGARNIGGVGTAKTTCTGSITPDNTIQPGVACGASNGNSTADPSTLFLDAPSLDYRPKPTSPAIDAGSASGPAAGEPALDFAGAPRSVDGNHDCAVRPDLGAYELQGQANTAPTATAAGPATAAPGDVLTFTGTGGDAEDAPAALTYAWAFSDGATATGTSAQHAYATAGTRTATLTVSDSHGCTATSTVTTKVAAGATIGGNGGEDKTAPVISAASLRARTLRLRFTLSEAATVTATLARRACRRVKGHRRCTYRRVARPRLTGAAGANAATLAPPKVPKQSRGRYRLTLVARDAAKNRSEPRRLAFRVR